MDAAARFSRVALLQVETVEVHDLVPRGDEVGYELCAGIRAGVDFGESAKLRVGAKDEVGTCGRPLWRAALAVDAREGIAAWRDLLPLRAHVEQVDEEVVRQRLGTLGEDAFLGAVDIRAENTQASDEDFSDLGRKR